VKGGVQREHCVALRENEAIPIRVISSSVGERAVEKGGEDIGDRQRRSDMSHVGPLRLL
jgi:hypothetical protein